MPSCESGEIGSVDLPACQNSRQATNHHPRSEIIVSAAFENELKRYGPGAEGEPVVSTVQARAYCRRLAKSHYENFSIVSWLLPRRLHQHFYNVYAYCRWADDLGDEVAEAQQSLELLDWWRGQLNDCYAGSARHPVFVALDETIQECRIPRQPFEDLISAFEQDQRINEYETFADLRDYCRLSADPVGRLVLFICGQHSESRARLSDSICTGLQLANFWQDVARDFDMGRVYLPAEDRMRFGYSPDDLKARTTNNAFLELMRFEVDRAREFLLAGLPLVEHLPGRLRVDIELFARGGLKILDRIQQIEYRVWQTRPVVTRRDAAGLLAGCLWRTMWRQIGFGRSRVEHPTITEEPKTSL